MWIQRPTETILETKRTTKKKRTRARWARWAGLSLALAGLSSCSFNSAKTHYLLAEKLWSDGKYAAAVSEFEKVYARDKTDKLGLQALFRAAMTETLFLNQYEDALRKFRLYIDSNTDASSSWEARRQIGEILFSKTDRYDEAIQHYRSMIKDRPDDSEVPEFWFRIGKAQFYLWQFGEAIGTFHELRKRFPKGELAEKAALEIGLTYFTRGEQHPGGKGPGMESYQEAIDAFQRFLREYPSSKLAAQARFGIANCLEEMDQLDAAYHQYEELLKTYPSPNVIRIKMARISERKSHKTSRK